MALFTDALDHDVRLERMRPEQVAAVRQTCPAVYVPFGSIEWHGYHNPVGLDALKAHEQLVGLAARVGGVVYPPVFFGTGGGHTDWPASYMVSGTAMQTVVADLLHGFERDGFKGAVLLSGHYPNITAYMTPAVVRYREHGGTMEVLCLVENQAPDVGGDHAAAFETSYMMYLLPETQDTTCLNRGSATDVDHGEQRHNWMGPEWEGHPCYGLVGMDPRAHASTDLGRVHTERLIDHLAAWVADHVADRT